MFRGVWVATITPFTPEGSLDEPALVAHLARLRRGHVHGFVAAGTTGEPSTWSADERHRIFAHHRDACAPVGALPGCGWMAGCGGNSTSHVLELLEEAASFSPRAALVVTPYYNRPTTAGLLAHYFHLAERSPLPIVVYHIPIRAAVSIPVDAMLELLNHPKILGVKDSSGSFSYWTSVARGIDPTKSLLAGDDDAFAAILALGGHGIISAAANWIPGVFTRIYDAFERQRWAEGFALQKQVQPVIKSLFLESNPGPLKYALGRAGHLTSALRLPLVPVQPATERAIDAGAEAWQRHSPSDFVGAPGWSTQPFERSGALL